MTSILGEVLTILVLLVVNGLLAMSEITVVASRRVPLEQRAAEGGRGAQAALAPHQEPTRFLSTVQIGITLIGILSGAPAGPPSRNNSPCASRSSEDLRPTARPSRLAWSSSASPISR